MWILKRDGGENVIEGRPVSRSIEIEVLCVGGMRDKARFRSMLQFANLMEMKGLRFVLGPSKYASDALVGPSSFNRRQRITYLLLQGQLGSEFSRLVSRLLQRENLLASHGVFF